jgi:single-strand DNA-binding protein
VDFHNLVAWNKLAELCSQLLAKGSKVYIEGRLQTRDWADDQGNKKYKTEVVIDEMIVLTSKRREDGEGEMGSADNHSGDTSTPNTSTDSDEINLDEVLAEDFGSDSK